MPSNSCPRPPSPPPPSPSPSPSSPLLPLSLRLTPLATNMNLPPKLTAVLLDFDGLLVDTEATHHAAYEAACAARGAPLHWSFADYTRRAHFSGAPRAATTAFFFLSFLDAKRRHCAWQRTAWRRTCRRRTRHWRASRGRRSTPTKRRALWRWCATRSACGCCRAPPRCCRRSPPRTCRAPSSPTARPSSAPACARFRRAAVRRCCRCATAHAVSVLCDARSVGQCGAVVYARRVRARQAASRVLHCVGAAAVRRALDARAGARL